MKDPKKHDAKDDAKDDARQWAETRAQVLYAGEQVRHRSCGVSIAETFSEDAEPYVGLRKGGLTGCATCGAIQAGTLVLARRLGGDDPVGPAPQRLVDAAHGYERRWRQRLGLADDADVSCRALTAQFEDFRGPQRHQHCTTIAETVAGCVAEGLAEAGEEIARPTLPDR